jgi:hypothetical protein
MDTRITPDQKWELFFSALLKSRVPNLDFQVKVEGEDILINTTDKLLVETIQDVLTSPEKARASLPYTLTNSSKNVSSVQLQEIIYPEAIAVEHGDGQKIFSRILGEANLKRVGCPNWDEEEKETTNQKILFAKNDNLESLSQHQVDFYRDLFSHASYAEFRNALAVKDDDYKPLPQTKNKGILAKHIHKILFKKNDTFNFDYGLLMKCLIAPSMFLRHISSTDNYEMRINKNHLISYISTVIKEGFILLPQGDANAATQQATPITFNMGQAIPVKTNFTFLVDCSSSMNAGFNEFKKYIHDYIIKITLQDDLADADISITPFETVMQPTKTFTVVELKRNPSLLATYFSTLVANGNTTLDLTIAETLKKLKQHTQDINDIVIICTDGEDSYGKQHLEQLKDRSAEIKSKINPPKLYTVGFGERYDEKKLETLGQITGCEHIKLNDTKDLDKLMELLKIPEITKARVLATFVQELEAVPTEITVVTHENDLGVPKQQGTLTIPGNFKVSGKSYHVDKGAPSLQPADEKQVGEVELMPMKHSSLEQQLNSVPKDELTKMLAKLGFFGSLPAQASLPSNDVQPGSLPSPSRSTSPTP